MDTAPMAGIWFWLPALSSSVAPRDDDLILDLPMVLHCAKKSRPPPGASAPSLIVARSLFRWRRYGRDGGPHLESVKVVSRPLGSPGRFPNKIGRRSEAAILADRRSASKSRQSSTRDRTNDQPPRHTGVE